MTAMPGGGSVLLTFLNWKKMLHLEHRSFSKKLNNTGTKGSSAICRGVGATTV